jgi:TonB family protein
MNARAILLSTTLPALLAGSLSAQDPPTPTIQKSEIQMRAESLMNRARHLSDIRAKNAPAFRLKATFSFVGKDLENKQGTYTEVWVSDSQWRRETTINDLVRVEVGTPNRIWKLDNSKEFPETAARLPALMEIFPYNQPFHFERIEENTTQQIAGECAVTSPGPHKEKQAFCFDKKSGAILETVSPEIRPISSVAYSCVYGKFRKFGDSWFPREMACFEDQHRKIEGQVVDLSAEPSPDAALFNPPAGARELGRCAGTSVPPVQTLSPQPGFPSGGYSEDSTVALSLIVDTHGKPQDLKVSQSAGKDFDNQAMTTVQKWRFKPATCDGDPMPMEITLDVHFSHQGMGGGRSRH